MAWGFSQPNFQYDVSFGRARGHQPIFIVGSTDGRDTSEHTIWDLPDRTIEFLTAGEELFVTSTDVSDTACSITVIGLGHDWVEKGATVQLDGQNPVSIGDFRIVNRAFVRSVGAVGDIYISTAGTKTAGVPDDLATVQSYIVAGKNVTHNGFFGVGAGNALSISSIRAGTDSTSKTAKTKSFYRQEGEPDLQFNSFQISANFPQQNFSFPFSGTLDFSVGKFTPFMPEKTILYYTAQPANAGTDIFFSVDCLLVDLKDFGSGII